MQQSGEHRIAIDRTGMFCLAAVTASIFVSNSGIPFVVPLIVRHFGVTNAIAGLAVTLEMGGIALTCLLYAPHVPRFNARLVCRICLIVLLGLDIATILSRGVAPFLVCRALSGLVAGGINVTTSSIAGRSTIPERNFAVLLGTLGALGIALSLILPQAKNVGPAIGMTSLHTIYALYFLFHIAGLCSCWRLPSPARLLAGDADPDAPPLTPLRRLPVHTLALLPGLGFMSFGVGSLSTFVVSLGTEQAGLAIQAVGLVMMAGAMVRIGGPFIGSHASSRFHAITLAAVVLSADALIGMLLSHAQTPLTFALLAPILTASTSIFFPVLLGTMSRLEPAGRLAGMHTVFAMGGQSIASFVGGAVSRPGNYFANGYVVAAGMALAAVFLYRGLKAADQQRFGRP